MTQIVTEVNLDLQNINGYTALMLAVIPYHTEAVQYLIDKGVDLNLQDKDGYTALHHSIGVNDVEIMQKLVSHGADPNLKGKGSTTPLLFGLALEVQLSVEAVKYLVGKGADLYSVDKDGLTALITAASHNNVEIVKYLIEEGVVLNLQSLRGWTALMEAVSHGNMEVMGYLIDKGADVNLRNGLGNTAFKNKEDGDLEQLSKVRDVLRKIGFKYPNDREKINPTIEKMDLLIAEHLESSLQGAQIPIYPEKYSISGTQVGKLKLELSDKQPDIGLRFRLKDDDRAIGVTLREDDPIKHIESGKDVLIEGVLEEVSSYLPSSDIKNLKQVPDAVRKHVKKLKQQRENHSVSPTKRSK